jgi:hypothetical protein
MGGPSDMELGEVNHSTIKKTHATQRHIGSQRTIDNTENTVWFPTKFGISSQGLKQCTVGKQTAVTAVNIKVHH